VLFFATFAHFAAFASMLLLLLSTVYAVRTGYQSVGV
jgi:hypothetical protein